MKVTMLFPVCKKVEVLDYSLYSLAQQKTKHKVDIIILNDNIPDGTEEVCNKYKKKLNIRYVFTGERNLGGEFIWRVPGFALNYGIKQAKGEVIIITGADLFHLNNSIDRLVALLLKNKKIIATQENVYFDDGRILNFLRQKCTMDLPPVIAETLKETKRTKYAGTLPYFMGLYKQELIDIGGYDEDLTGFAGEDDDLVNRLLLKGLKYCYSGAKIVHLYHPISNLPFFKNNDPWSCPAWVYNYNILIKRRGIIVRNKNREWGVL